MVDSTWPIWPTGFGILFSCVFRSNDSSSSDPQSCSGKASTIGLEASASSTHDETMFQLSRLFRKMPAGRSGNCRWGVPTVALTLHTAKLLVAIYRHVPGRQQHNHNLLVTIPHLLSTGMTRPIVEPVGARRHVCHPFTRACVGRKRILLSGIF